MTWEFFAASSWNATGLILTWLIQSTVLLAVGLLAGRLLRKRGPAVQSAVYRTTLGAVILCPVASTIMAGMGCDGLLIQLPAMVRTDEAAIVNQPVEPAPTVGYESTRFHTDDMRLQGKKTPDSPTLLVTSVHNGRSSVGRLTGDSRSTRRPTGRLVCPAGLNGSLGVTPWLWGRGSWGPSCWVRVSSSASCE